MTALSAPPWARLQGCVAGAIKANLERPEAGDEFLRLLRPGAADAVLSYRGLIELASSWTAFFQSAGIRPGERVIIILKHSPELYAAYIGALLGGMVPAMFSFPSPKYAEEEYFRTVGILLAGAGARCVVCFDELAQKLVQRERAALDKVRVVTPGEVASSAGPTHFAERAADDVAFLQYSSGTTGVKKGVAVTHRALLGHIEGYAAAIRLNADDRIASWLPLYHDMGLITCFFMPLLALVPVVAMDPFDWVKRPALWLRAASDHRATLAWMPNFAFSLMASAVPERDLNGLDLSSLRGLVNCSEPLMAESVAKFVERFGAHGFREESLAASYAMAENTFAVTSAGFPGPLHVDWIDGDAFRGKGICREVPSAAPGALPMMSSGRALPANEIAIFGDGPLPLPERHLGEIVIRSPFLMQGYDNNAEATRLSLRDGWLHTGDLGYLAEGELYVTGRKNDLIIIGGKNIYPQDIEAAVGGIDGILPGRVVACGHGDHRLGTQSLILLAETEESVPSERERLRQEIYNAVVQCTDSSPGEIRLLPPRWLLKSSSGKLARRANLERFFDMQKQETDPSGEGAAGDADDLQGIVRRCVMAILARRQRLGSGEVGERTSLVQSGLIDSFSIAELLLELEGALGRPVPAGTLDSFDTIAEIVSALASDGPEKPRPVFDYGQAIKMEADRPLAVRRGGGFWTLYYRILFRLKGIGCGEGLQVKGPILLELLGDPRNIRIGRNVTLMPGVHLKIRENGKIVLHDGVKLDTNVRLVAANDARIEIGAASAIGMGAILNAGQDIRIGRGAIVAGYCVLNASDHGMAAGTAMASQPYIHAPIALFDDVWLGAQVYVSRGSRMGPGSIAATGAVVAGDVPPDAIVEGRPARVIKFRR